jgi:outer membrane protein assembly factor BamB
VWSVSLPGSVVATPALDSKSATVVASTTNGTVGGYALSSGRQLWQTTIPGNVNAGVVIGQGNAYIGSLNGTLYALHDATGTEVWAYNTSGPITAAVCADSNQLIVGSGDGTIHYLNPSSGAPTYTIVVGQPVAGVAGATGFVVSVGQDGKVLGSKPEATNPDAWTTIQGTSITAQPTVVNGEVIVASGNGTVSVYTPPGSPAF